MSTDTANDKRRERYNSDEEYRQRRLEQNESWRKANRQAVNDYKRGARKQGKQK